MTNIMYKNQMRTETEVVAMIRKEIAGKFNTNPIIDRYFKEEVREVAKQYIYSMVYLNALKQRVSFVDNYHKTEEEKITEVMTKKVLQYNVEIPLLREYIIDKRHDITYSEEDNCYMIFNPFVETVTEEKEITKEVKKGRGKSATVETVTETVTEEKEVVNEVANNIAILIYKTISNSLTDSTNNLINALKCYWKNPNTTNTKDCFEYSEVARILYEDFIKQAIVTDTENPFCNVVRYTLKNKAITWVVNQYTKIKSDRNKNFGFSNTTQKTVDNLILGITKAILNGNTLESISEKVEIFD